MHITSYYVACKACGYPQICSAPPADARGAAMLAGEPPDKRAEMTRITAAQHLVQQASDLAAVLDAAYEAFEAMLSAIDPAQDPASGLFAAFVMAAASAANGRNAVALAPSLPGRPLTAVPAGPQPWPQERAERLAEAVGGLSHLVAGRLAQAAARAPDTGDRVACAHAARSARDICGLLGISGP
jgi:hypothetical protein